MTIKDLKDNWQIVMFVIGVIGACAVFPFKLGAVEKRTEKVETSVDKLTEYITEQRVANEIEKEKQKVLKNPPPGFQWDEDKQEWIKIKAR